MSLIKCPECGHSVSSKADFCPECGVKIAGNVKRCPICQQLLLMDVKQCPHCQTHFETQPKIVLEPGTESDKEVQSEEATPPVPPKKSTPWYLLLFVIVIVGIGAYLYWDNYQQRRYSEEKAFELLRNCTDPLNFEDFIARYPDSKHLDEVREQLKALQKEDAVWEVVASSRNPEDFRNFMQDHPRSPFIKMALHKIDSLEWRAADKVGTAEAYDRYIANHDDGEYITEAYSARDVAREREDRIRRDSIAVEQAKADSLAQLKEATGIDELMRAE